MITFILAAALAQDCPNGQCQMQSKKSVAVVVAAAKPVAQMPVKTVKRFGSRLKKWLRR
jgi:hypothetical protein